MRYNVMDILYKFSDMVKCICYISLGFNGCSAIDAILMGGHYKTGIISSVGHPRLNLVVPLVLCTVAYNDQSIDVVL